MTLTPSQLPLTFGRDDAYTFSRFVPGPNSEVLEQLRELIGQQAVSGEGRCVFVHGNDGVGKSHLLQSVCHAASEQEKTSLYFSFKDLINYSPDLLQGLEELAFVCLDDLEDIENQSNWENALFHLFNRIRESGNTLIVGANSAPAQLKFSLADLTSRMHWGLTYQVQDLPDHDKIRVLQERAARRNFDLPNEVGEFMIRRLPRDMHVLCDILDKLDDASLAAQRKLTVPFVRQVLEGASS